MSHTLLILALGGQACLLAAWLTALGVLGSFTMHAPSPAHHAMAHASRRRRLTQGRPSGISRRR